MPLRRLDILLRDVRDQTGTRALNVPGDGGIEQREFIRYANEAQTQLYNRIALQRASIWVKEGFISTLAGTASYALPTDIHIAHNVLKAEYSHSGNLNAYGALELRTPKQEISVRGYPTSYFLRDGTIVLSPIPDTSVTNGIRLNYQYTVPDLDIRRGTITSYTSGGTDVTSITLTEDSVLTYENEAELTGGWVDYVTVVDKYGVIKAKSIPVVAYNANTNVLTCNHTLAAGESITAGNYIVFGSWATTHSVLHAICERYITHYIAAAIQMRGSNQEADVIMNVLATIEKEILDSYANLEEDVPAVPISDYSMLDYAEEL